MRTLASFLVGAALLAGATAGLPGCSKPPPTPTATGTLFGHRAVFTADPDHPNAAQVARSVARRLEGQLTGLLSVYEENSDISNLNRFALDRYWPVSRETARILAIADEYSRLTDGAFSITMGPLRYRWGFTGEVVLNRPIPPEVLRSSLAGTEPDNLVIDGIMIRLRHPLTRIDLGELMTSYGLDLSIIRLREMEARDVLIDLGIMARGLRRDADRPPWTVPVSHPVDPDRSAGIVELSDQLAYARVTTHDRTVTIDGTDYHGYLDPHTGLPAEGISAAYVLAPTATMAHALAEGLLVGGLEAAPEMLGRFDFRAEAMMVTDTVPAQVYLTPGFAERFFLEPGEDWQLFDLIRVEPDPARDESL